MEEQLWKRFSPSKINPKLCMARTWCGGVGGQCTKPRARLSRSHHSAEFCQQHGSDESWRVHGRVDGAIPDVKLCEFLRAAASAAPSLSELAPDSRAANPLPAESSAAEAAALSSSMVLTQPVKTKRVPMKKVKEGLKQKSATKKAKGMAKAKRMSQRKGKGPKKAFAKAAKTTAKSVKVGKWKVTPCTKDEMARQEAERDRQAGILDTRLLLKKVQDDHHRAPSHGVKRTITVQNGPARGWHVTGFLIDNAGCGGRGSKIHSTAVRWRLESPRRSRVFKVWKSRKAEIPSLADAVNSGAFEQIVRAIRPQVLRKLNAKRAGGNAPTMACESARKRQAISPTPQDGHRPGCEVQLHGLRAAVDLNGQSGVLDTYNAASGRWRVMLKDGQIKNVRSENLATMFAGSNVKNHGCNVEHKSVTRPGVAQAPPADQFPVVAAEQAVRDAIELVASPQLDGRVRAEAPTQEKAGMLQPNSAKEDHLGEWACNCLGHLRRLPHCVGDGPPVVHLMRELTMFGRGEGTHVQLRSLKTPQMLSRNHATIRRDASGFVLADPGSMNGIHINGERVLEHVLKPGDVLTFGVSTAEPEFDYMFEVRPEGIHMKV